MQGSVKPALSPKWQWPVNLTAYDRRAGLRVDELTALDTIVQLRQFRNNRWPHQTRMSLERLLQPIYDVLDVVSAKGNARSGAIGVFLRQMLYRKASFWAWTPEQWVEILCTSGIEFRIKHHISGHFRAHVIAVGYFLCGFKDFRAIGRRLDKYPLASKLFGPAAVDLAVEQVGAEILRWGYGVAMAKTVMPGVVCAALLTNRSPRLEDITKEVIDKLREETDTELVKKRISLFTRVLNNLGIIPLSITTASPIIKGGEAGALDGIVPEWAKICQKWRDTSTFAFTTRRTVYYCLLQVGRWLAKEHPDIISPGQWTRELAAEYVSVVNNMTVGQWAHATHKMRPEKIGKPLAAKVKARHLSALRMFFQDCQEWNWIRRRFDPGRALKTPRSIQSLIGPDPRVIADDIWAKLLWAGLNLIEEDLNEGVYEAGPAKRGHYYPLELVRAVAIVWLFGGLRLSEIRRLRIGCVCWQREDVTIIATGEVLPKDAVCMLDVPVSKTNTAFTKPVDYIVGEAIVVWERIRPDQPVAVDLKTGELVNYLFAYRGLRMGRTYINDTLIPMLCQKAGVPFADARGNITSHRARSTIASQLYNAKDPMTLMELRDWLGHRWASSTENYIKASPTKLAKAYKDAGYFGRNVRVISVLIDQDAIKSGAAAAGEPWRYVDMGHGYCTYDYFEQCPHRMACARCPFYRPKESILAQLLESKVNLQHMLQEIPLRDEERAAVEGDLEAMERLCKQLVDVPTPAGPTPRELGADNSRELPILPVCSKDDE